MHDQLSLRLRYVDAYSFCYLYTCPYSSIDILPPLLPTGSTVAVLLLFMISAATACKVDDVFCFENCNTSDVTQFCNCVVDEVVARNDSESLSNATLVQEFEDQAALILKTNLGFVWCCTFIIIYQYVPQGNKALTIYRYHYYLYLV